MYIEYDVEQDALFQRGHEKGHEEGEIKGLEKGIDIGEAKGLKKVAIRCLEQGKTYEETAELTGLDIKAIAKIDKERKEK